MKTSQWTLLLIVLFGAFVISCENTDTNTDTETSEPDAMVMEQTTTKKTAKPEVDDEQYVKLAEAWRQSVDEALGKTIDQSIYEYTCDGWGGTLTLGQDGEAIVYREQLSGGDDGAKWIRFYSAKKDTSKKPTVIELYNEEDQVVMTWTLSKLFTGDDATAEETIFYLRNDGLIKAIQRKAKGTSKTIDKNLAAAEYQAIKGDMISDYQVMYRDLIELDVENALAHFCQ